MLTGSLNTLVNGLRARAQTRLNMETDPGLDAANDAAPRGEATLRAVVGDPELMTPSADTPFASFGLASFGGRDSLRFEETLTDVLGAQPAPELDLAPAGGSELAPVGDREFAPGDGGAAAGAGSALSALRGFLGGTGATATPPDSFDFTAPVGDGELALADDSPLDPFADAIDPSWMGELMLTLLPDGTIIGGTPGDGQVDGGLDPMAHVPVDGSDGWVL